jgi:two-component system, response regulator
VSTNAIEILLVEDDPDDASLTMRALRKHKLAENIELVTDGAQALDFLFSKGDYAAREANPSPPKVVFLDLKLPKINGLQVLRELKADARLRSVPVVVLTSSSEERDLREAYQLGVNSYIVKPIDFNQFLGAVGELGLYWLFLNQRPAQ